MAINTGVTALARELGVDPVSISRRMSQGQTVEYIREAIRQQKSRIGKVQETRGRRGRAKAQDKAQAQTRSYTPSRRVSIAGAPSPPAAPIAAKKNGNGRAPSEAEVEEEYERRREKLTEAELRLAIAQADEREEKAAILRRDNVPKAQVNRILGSAHVKARDKLFRIPAMYCDQLAVCDDPVEIHKLLMDALIEATAELRTLTINVASLADEDVA